MPRGCRSSSCSSRSSWPRYASSPSRRCCTRAGHPAASTRSSRPTRSPLMKPLTLNLLTSAGTAVLLGALALPAVHQLRGGADPPAALAATPAQRSFGVYVDAWHVDDWARDVGAAPQMVATFEAFSRDRTIDPFLRETERQGIRQVMVSWEPWRPPPIDAGTANDGLAQPRYTNAEIARGADDAYIRRFARSLARFR